MYLTSKERLGLIVLASLLALAMTVNYSIGYFLPKNEESLADEEELMAFARFKASLSRKENEKSFSRKPTSPKINNEIEYFDFDPNQLSMEQWMDLGLTKKTARNIINYREAGGEFFHAEDLQKIYTLSEKDYERLEPWIQIKSSIKDKKPVEEDQDKIFEEEEAPNSGGSVIQIELNSAGLEELEKLAGIGPVYAERIIKYRELLGGFYDKSQLLEVYGISQDTYEKIEHAVEIDTSNLTPLSFFKADFKQLLQHPYIDKYEARGIEKMRTLDIRIERLAQVKEAGIFTEEKWKKIRPYLKLE